LANGKDYGKDTIQYQAGSPTSHALWSADCGLESTVITHGLPQPVNLQLARDMEATVRAQGATPATIALMDGSDRVGLSSEELEQLAGAVNPHKVSLRDFGYALESA